MAEINKRKVVTELYMSQPNPHIYVDFYGFTYYFG